MTSINDVVVEPKTFKYKIDCDSRKCDSVTEYYEYVEGNVTGENAADTIIRTREKFEASLLKYKGPTTFIPTIFKNHASHFRFCREREKAHLPAHSPMKPPDQPLVISTFADEVYKNIQCNFRQTPSCSVFLKHNKNSKVVYLAEKVFGEEAFDELLMRKEPHFYSEDPEEVIKSKFVEKDLSQWSDQLTHECENSFQFLVEFCMILPEAQVSTVMVICIDCGEFVETQLNDITIQLAKEDIKHNLTRMVFKEGDSDSVRSIIRLPMRGSCADDSCCFTEGLMGATPLTGNLSKPSVFVRIRLVYFCNYMTLFNDVVHKKIKQEDEMSEELANMKVG